MLTVRTESPFEDRIQTTDLLGEFVCEVLRVFVF